MHIYVCMYAQVYYVCAYIMYVCVTHNYWQNCIMLLLRASTMYQKLASKAKAMRLYSHVIHCT
jgi:hypothetical protein